MAERTWSAYVVPTEHRRINEFVGLVLATAAILLGLSLISFNPDDPSFNISRNPRFSDSTSNFVGVIGSYAADAFLQTWGLSAFMIPIFLGVYAFYWLASWPVKNFWPRFVGMVLMMVTLAGTLGMFSFHVREHIPAGGILGTMLADNLQGALNPAGTAVVLLAAFLISLFLSTKFSFTSAVAFAKPKLQVVSALAERWSERRKESKAVQQAVVEKVEKKEKAPKKQIVVNEPSKTMETVEVDASPTGRSWREAPAEGLIAAAIRLKPSKTPKTAAVAEFPPLSLLNGPAAVVKVDEEELRDRARLIEEKSREFDVVGSVQQIHPGPVVTTFEFKPDSGVKYSRIIGLGDDLCLALEAESVRIDRIPGKSTVGIEVPNDERATIVLRELLESAEYQQSSHRLPLALGKDITGKIVVSDLAKMPHLLAAGSTGTGKSVSINAMILSLLFRSRPDQVKLIMIDPKRLELGLYQDIPHLLVPVVTEPKIAQNALKWAVTEMETRYKKLAKRGVRNLDAYNEQIRQLPIPGLNAKEGEEEEDREPLPFIVIVIDELADLMMTAPREVEESITRLAQMARAVGIHLILATQRPSVDVITGLIKANFPSRISFRVASKVDSRTILDSNGAQQLLGRGDMLFMPPGSSRLMRVHGPLTTEDEVAAVVEFLKKQGKPVYNERILESADERMEPGEGSGEVDELYDQAVEMVLEMGKASTSVLQRRPRIGYGRAASLLDAMERNGIVGPPDGSKPRAVLISKEEHSRDN